MTVELCVNLAFFLFIASCVEYLIKLYEMNDSEEEDK